MPRPARAPASGPRSRRFDVLAWALWDCGSTGLNAIVVTFVFSVYLTNTVGNDDGGRAPESALGLALTVAGLTVAVLAPALGVLVQAPARRRAALTVLTALAIGLTTAMAGIRPEPSYLYVGLGLLAATAAAGDLASVPYNAMLRQLSVPENSGRISGFGWAAGYFGSVLLLALIYAGFIAGDGPTRGALGLPVADGVNVRAAMVAAALWFAVFSCALLIRSGRILRAVPPGGARPGATKPPGAYRQVWIDLRAEWRRDPNLVRFLGASAIFRDGLVGVFTFGAVVGVKSYGVSAADVLLFGVAASVVAALGALVGGLADDRVGAKPVIVVSLTAMLAVTVTLLAVSGPLAFWLLGLLLCLFIGPIQSASRTLLLRMTGEGREGVVFGLYTMTGRAVAFLAPSMFALFVDGFGAVRAGLGGVALVLAAGLAAMLTVRTAGWQGRIAG